MEREKVEAKVKTRGMNWYEEGEAGHVQTEMGELGRHGGRGRVTWNA